MRVLRKAFKDTWLVFGKNWKSAVFPFAVITIGCVLGFLFLGTKEAMDEIRILALYTFGPIGMVFAIVFLWELWLAPYKLIDEKLVEISDKRHFPKVVGEASESPHVKQWKRVSSLHLYQVAELCGGISPDNTITQGSNDRARAAYTELEAALRSRELKGDFDRPSDVSEYTRISRKELQGYFAKHQGCPEFLKD